MVLKILFREHFTSCSIFTVYECKVLESMLFEALCPEKLTLVATDTTQQPVRALYIKTASMHMYMEHQTNKTLINGGCVA